MAGKPDFAKERLIGMAVESHSLYLGAMSSADSEILPLLSRAANPSNNRDRCPPSLLLTLSDATLAG